MGKSITVIYTLKCAYNPDTAGSFYIHCKFLYNAFQCNYEKVKNILKDEIVYLFKNEYNQYIQCCTQIEKYIIKRNSTFWDLILIIVICLTNKGKKYLFAIDHYNKDTINLENKGIKSLISLGNENLHIIAVCSMDDKRIKDYKINKFLSRQYGNIFITLEIENFFDLENKSIDDDQIFYQTLEKIGKTMKNYNILKYIYENEDVLDDYIDDLKKG